MLDQQPSAMARSIAALAPPDAMMRQKPTLAEIAAVAGAGRAASLMRRWYDPKFGLGPEVDDEDPEWTVEVSYEVITTRDEVETLTVRAANEADAIAMAKDDVRDAESGGVEFGAVKARRVLDA